MVDSINKLDKTNQIELRQSTQAKVNNTKKSVFQGQKKIGYKVSNDKIATINLLSDLGSKAKTSFNKQLADDGWAGDLADGISVLWGSKNRATKVRKDLQTYDNNVKRLNEAAKTSDAEFEKVFREIAGDYNQAAINAYKKNPTEENFKKAFPKLMNSTKRVADYKQSQQTGATVVKTTGKIAGTAVGVAAVVATGGTASLGVAAISAAVASVGVDETDRLHITGQHKDADGKTVKDKSTFRAGTNHGKILKDAAVAGASVYGAGKVAMGAKALAAGSKTVQIGLNVMGDAAVGAGAEYAQTGNVSAEGTLINAGFSALGASAGSGALKDGIKKVIKNFKNSTKSNTKYTIPKNKKEEYELAKAKIKASAANTKRNKSKPAIEVVDKNPAGIKIVKRNKSQSAKPTEKQQEIPQKTNVTKPETKQVTQNKPEIKQSVKTETQKTEPSKIAKTENKKTSKTETVNENFLYKNEIQTLKEDMNNLTTQILDMQDLLRSAKANNGSVVTRYGETAYAQDLEQGLNMLRAEYKNKYDEIQNLIKLEREMNK